VTERELPVSEYCQVFREWAGLVHERARTAEEDYDKERWQKVSDALRIVELAIVKSCYLGRRLYLNEDTREVPCPIHKGHWSGCKWGEEMCPEGCQDGANVTGWLQVPHLYVQPPPDEPHVSYTQTRCYQCGGKRGAAIHD
jgi:hypothetical protein